MSNTKKKAGNRFFILQRQLCRRRLWMIAAVVLYMVMYYPVAVVMLIARSDEIAKTQQMTQTRALSQRLAEVGTWIGMRQSFVWVIVLMAVILAIHGFSYLFSMEKQDFYDSQPVSRMERFWNIYANGFLIFEIPMVLCLLLSTALAAAMNGMNTVVFLDAMIQMGRVTLIFFASYSVGILAVMLTGNLIVSGIMTAFLLFADRVYQELFQSFQTMFYKTYCYYGKEDPSFLLSPWYNAQEPSRWLSRNYIWQYSPTTGELLRSLLADCWRADLVMLLAGAVLLWIGVWLYRRRREEYAGMTVIYRPVRTLVRILISVAAGLFAGVVIINLFNSPTSRTGTVFMLVGVVVAAVLCSGVVEMVYDLDIWKFFGKFWEIAAAAVLAAGIFALFRYDVLGYDRYVPKAEEIKSAALYVYNDSSFYYPMDSNPNDSVNDEQHVMEDMELTDIPALLAVTRPAMEAQRTMSADGNSNGWSAEVCYRLKNGRSVYRSILIPYDTDAEVLDRIVASDAYKEGVFPIYSNAIMQEASEKNGTVSFSNGYQTLSGSGMLYQKFEEAYKKDLEQYSFSLMNRESSIGRVSFQTYRPFYMDQEYDVYPSYENTIAFLKEYDLYPEKATAQDVLSITVSDYQADSSSEAEYTDPEQIQEIMNHALVVISSNWKQNDMADYRYDLSVSTKQTSSTTYYSCYFRKGEVPAFVLQDLEKNRIENSDEDSDLMMR